MVLELITSSTSKTCTSERPQLIVLGWVVLSTGMKKLLWTVLHLHMGSWCAYVEDSFPVGADRETLSPRSKAQLAIVLRRNDLPKIQEKRLTIAKQSDLWLLENIHENAIEIYNTNLKPVYDMKNETKIDIWYFNEGWSKSDWKI